MDLQRPYKLSHQRSRSAREERQIVRIPPTHRTADPKTETLRAGADRDRADDPVQDTLGRALIKEKFWQPGTNLRAWLFTIMHNQNVNNVRQYIRESAVVDLAQISAKLTAATDPTASRKMFELERALAQLPLEQRQVIVLVGLEGMSYLDAAGILTIPVGTVRLRLSRGRDVLRRLLDMDERRIPAAALPQAA